MPTIKFSIVKGKPESSTEIQLNVPEEYLGEYVIRELTAQEGLDAENEFIMENKEAQDNPDKIGIDAYTIKLVEKATTLNGNSFKMPELETVPKKYFTLLVASYEKLNGISNAEARFLLQPS